MGRDNLDYMEYQRETGEASFSGLHMVKVVVVVVVVVVVCMYL